MIVNLIQQSVNYGPKFAGRQKEDASRARGAAGSLSKRNDVVLKSFSSKRS